ILQLAIASQKHDGHRGELLCETGQTKIALRIDSRTARKLADAVTLFEQNPAPVFDQGGESRGIRPRAGRQYRVDGVVYLLSRDHITLERGQPGSKKNHHPKTETLPHFSPRECSPASPRAGASVGP